MKKHIIRCLIIATCPTLFLIFLWLVSFGAFDLIEAIRSPYAVAIDCVFIFSAIMISSENDIE